MVLPGTSTWGSNAGKYMVTGFGPPTVDTPWLFVAGPDAAFSEFVEFPTAGLFLSTPVIAPSTFGIYGENILVSAQSSGIFAVAPDKTIATLVPGDPALPYFGLAFAPTGFGTVGDQLLASRANSGEIFAVGPDGARTLFTTLDLLEDQHGLRQMAFAPAGFLANLGINEELLLVSVAHRGQAGGTLGDVLAVDAFGITVASLRVIEDLTKFDPRGLLVTSAGELLVIDTSDPIILATSTDFRPGRFANKIPEPPSVALLLLALSVVFVQRRQG